MKTNLLVRAGCLGLACVWALAANNSSAQEVTISKFDNDLRAFCWTNFWHADDSPMPTLLAWTNTGNPAGSMWVVLDWEQGVPWGWQDRKINAHALCEPVILRRHPYLEFDAAVLTEVSQTNNSGGYGGIEVIAMTGYPCLQSWYPVGTVSLPVTNGWQRFQVSTAEQPECLLMSLVFNFYQFPNTNYPTRTQVLIDNIRLAPWTPCSARLEYVKALQGLYFLSTTGLYGRGGIETFQDGSRQYMWPGFCPASYSFTVGAFPANTNFSLFMYLVPENVTYTFDDFFETNCIWMQLASDAQGNANWVFRWKTNSPGSMGQFYEPGAQIVLTNPTPLGKWTLAFNNNTNVTMTAPNGASTNFIMGAHPNVPDISGVFSDPGVVYLGVFTGASDAGALSAILTGAQLSGGITQVSNNWLAEVELDPGEWSRVGDSPIVLVPTNCWWLNWTSPSPGFILQTNCSLSAVAGWSSNGLPAPIRVGDVQHLLIKPNTFPGQNALFYRLIK